jgi:uncharacterized membrane protein
VRTRAGRGNYSVENRIVPMRQFRAFLFDDGRYTAVDVPGDVYTAAFDVNDRGQVVGAFPNRERTAGFSFLREADGSYTRLPDVPGSFQTVAIGINNMGQIVGAYVAPTPDGVGKFGGFLLEDGKFTLIDFPGTNRTQVTGINDSSDMVGFYVPGGRTAGLQAAAASSTSPMAMPADVWVVRPE